MTSRARLSIVVCEPFAGPVAGLAQVLLDGGFGVVRCGDEESLLETVVGHRPEAVVYALAHDISVDVALLALLRRITPDLPLIVVVAGAPSEIASRLDAVKPTLLDLAALPKGGLVQAVREAILGARPARKSRAKAETAC